MSGKLYEVIDLLVREIDPLSKRWDKRLIHRETPLGTRWLLTLDHALNALQDQLTDRTTLTGSYFVQTAM